jgi:hypothetical protein
MSEVIYDINEQQYYFREPQELNRSIILNAGSTEMIRISPEGFYVRGQAVEQGPGEAEAVYAAFKQWMVWTSLTRNS